MKKAIFSAAALIIFSASAMAKDIDEKKVSNEIKKEEFTKVNQLEIMNVNSYQRIDCVDLYYAAYETLHIEYGLSETVADFLADMSYSNCVAGAVQMGIHP